MRTQPKFPLPQPVPTTPIRGAGIVRCDFNSPALRRLAARLKTKLNSKRAVLKPHRNSVGIIWRNQAFWWSTKGYYRNGKAGTTRRPFQHVLWEHYHRRPMPPRHEIFFRDRDCHNFTRGNLELLSKAAMYERIHLIGENNQPTLEQRGQISRKRWERAGNRLTGILLDQFNTGGRTVAAQLQQDR